MLPDRLAHGLDVMFCGTAASHASGLRGITMQAPAIGSGLCCLKQALPHGVLRLPRIIFCLALGSA